MVDEKLTRLQFSIDNASYRYNEAFNIRRQFLKKQELKAFQRSCLEAVTWIANATEWFEKNAKFILKEPKEVGSKKLIIKEEYLYLLGNKQIFNSFKHNMKITSLDELNYDETFLGIALQRVLWIESEHLDKENEVQFKSYQANFQNKEILITLQTAIHNLNCLKTEYLKKMKEPSE